MEQSVSIGDRLRSERQRLDLNQTELGERGSVTKKTQMLYEAGGRFPDAAYLAAVAAVGVDVRYVITGQREGPTPEALSADERYLLERFRSSPPALRDAALRVLLGGEPPAAKKSKKQVFSKEVTGQVAMGKIINKGNVEK